MTELTVLADVAVPARQERRRPGRRADVSPELVALMRAPTPAARVRVAVYDAPGFLLQRDGAARRPRSREYLVRVGASTLGLTTTLIVGMQAMYWAWG